VLLDNIRSLGNVGSIFRTSDAVLARKLYLTGLTGRPPRPEITKTALGAEETVPWEHVSDPRKAVSLLKEMGVAVVALEQTDASVPFDAFVYPFPACLVVGHEVTGVSTDILSLADGAVELPMNGSKESLNVSVAFGIAVYEMARQWHARQDS
jgi:tRNA G18 (ribose-2'-O)-methylase SpoU